MSHPPFAPRDDTATSGLPSLHRILTPDEFHQARQLSPAALDASPFPLLPPPAPRESTRVGPPAPNPQAHQLTGLAHVLTKYVAEPIMEHPISTAALLTAQAIPGVGQAVDYGFMGLMGKDVLEYSAQKAAELSLPADVRRETEAHPEAVPPEELGRQTFGGMKALGGSTERISGEQAAVEAAMLAAPGLIRKGVAKLKGAPAVADVAGGAAPAVDPAVQARTQSAIKQHMADVQDAWQKIFAPANRTPEAHEAAGILRATTGSMAAQYEQAAFKLDEFRRAVDPLPEADKLGFIDAIEGGRSQVNPEFQGPADAIRKTLDDTRDAIRNLGTGKLDKFIEDYFPHIWKDPEAAATAFKAGTEPADAPEAAKVSAGGHRPMEGSKAFLKQRTIPTTLEGMQQGLEPVTTNPVDLTLLKLREMQRYLMAHTSLNEMKDAGLVKYVASGEQLPDGHQFIDDKIATVFGPREGAVKLPEGANIEPEQVAVPGMRIMGRYSAPEAVATVVNNYLSPGLRGNAIYDAYRGLGNTLNQAQLGLSAFHLGFTSMDATVSRAALGLEYIASGDPLTGLAKLASAPAAPVTNLLLGRKIRAAYLNPEAATPEMQALANAVKEAGGRVRMDSFYQNSAPSRMIEAWRQGEYGKATALSLPAFFETAAKPLMEHIVPMQKLGIFGDMAKKVLADLPEDATLAERRQALGSAWDSVDNRMGQVVYDNLFWNKTFKDLAMGSVRSVGWNLGTIRELGGGVIDLAKGAKGLVEGRSPAEVMTHKAAYAIALPVTVGLYGALYQYLRTGEGPSEFKDYFHPKTGEVDADGNAERVQLPSYVKDLMAYAGSPWQTIKHKEAPLLSAVVEMLNNEDYFGDQIRNPDDPAVKQLQQEAEYIGKTALPFSITNTMETTRRGDQSAATKFGNWFGITPAKRSDVRSEAENQMADYLASRRMTGATPEDVEARKGRSELLNTLRQAGQGKLSGPDVEDAVTKAIEEHNLTPADIGKILKRIGTTPAQENFKRLTLPQALDVFQKSTPAEKAKFAEALANKLDRASQD